MFVIDTAVLRSALICVSTEEVRYYLNGVNIDPDGFVISTDGHRMFIGKLDPESLRPEKPFIIPRDTIKRAMTGYKDDKVEFDEKQLAGLAYVPIDGTFPEWQRCIPPVCDGKAAQFNPKYVADFGKISGLLGKTRSHDIRLHYNGDGPAGVSFPGNSDCFGVLMPIRVGAIDWESHGHISTSPKPEPEPEPEEIAEAKPQPEPEPEPVDPEVLADGADGESEAIAEAEEIAPGWQRKPKRLGAPLRASELRKIREAA